MKNHTELLLATPNMWQSRDLLIHVLDMMLNEFEAEDWKINISIETYL